MPRTVTDKLWKRAKDRAKRMGKGNNIEYIMRIYKQMGGRFKATPLDMIQMGGTSW